MGYVFAATVLLFSGFSFSATAQVPELLSPAVDEVVDNGCADGSDKQVWEFSWEPVEGAKRYHIFVQRLGSQFPLLNHAVENTSYTFEGKGYITPQNAEGWTWRVRAMVKGKWGPWSTVRTFSVEPINTDCSSSHIQ